MSRLTTAVACASVLASACRVEPTPAEYIDHQEPVAVVRNAAAEELQDRILAMGQALNRGDPAEAFQALAPSAEAYAVMPGRESILTGHAQFRGALDRITTTQRSRQLHDVRVSVGPRGDVAWFRAVVGGDEAADLSPLRLTGVYLRGDEGEWRLVQAHLSAPTAAPDSLPPNRVPGETPPAGG